MRRIVLLADALLCLGLVGADEEVKLARFDVTVDPEGAKVLVDGEPKGAAPLTVFDVTPGSHLVHIESNGYEPFDEFVQFQEGSIIQKSYTLTGEKGLLLITSEPTGAEVRDLSYNGMSLGTTPLLVTSMNVGSQHMIELSIGGYRPKKVNVKLADRRPVSIREELMRDAGFLECTTEPAGAEVFVNGTLRGNSPLTVSDVPKGVVTVSFKKNGYKDVTKEIRMSAGENQSLAVKLTPLPASLNIVTTPERAKVFVDNEYQGKSPVAMNDVAPGLHSIRVELEGYGRKGLSVELQPGESSTQEVQLENILGRVEIKTIPSNVQVLIDGKRVGVTKERTGQTTSDALAIENIEEGEHMLVLRLKGYQEFAGKISVKSKETTTIAKKLMRIFTPDTEIVTSRGTFRGCKVMENDDIIRLEVKKGINQDFYKREIRSVTPLD